MKRAPIILLLVLAGGVAVFAASFLLAQRICENHAASRTDDLEWLRTEFRLSDVEMEHVRQLHEGYLPKCAEMCRQIADKRAELEEILVDATNVTAAAEQELNEFAALRAKCQTQMLKHFMEVSQAMPPEQGRHYLAEMQRLTLGFHQQIEQSMSHPAEHEQGHH